MHSRHEGTLLLLITPCRHPPASFNIMITNALFITKYTTSTSVFGDGRISTHALRCQWRGLASIGNTCRRAPIRPISGFWMSKIPQNGWFPAQDPPEPPRKIWRRYSFILAGEIRNKTKKQANSKRYIHTLQVCLSACVDNKLHNGNRKASTSVSRFRVQTG